MYKKVNSGVYGPIPKRGLWKKSDGKFKKKYQELIELRKKLPPSGEEQKIMDYLDKLGVKYKREYNPTGLVNPATCYPLFFDFYLPKLKAAIEFDGPHHYKQLNGYGATKSCQERDCIKTKYCLYTGIKLLRIPYWESANMELIVFSFLNSVASGVAS